jgi:hypothetical protein
VYYPLLIITTVVLGDKPHKPYKNKRERERDDIYIYIREKKHLKTPYIISIFIDIIKRSWNYPQISRPSINNQPSEIPYTITLLDCV